MPCLQGGNFQFHPTPHLCGGQKGQRSSSLTNGQSCPPSCLHNEPSIKTPQGAHTARLAGWRAGRGHGSSVLAPYFVLCMFSTWLFLNYIRYWKQRNKNSNSKQSSFLSSRSCSSTLPNLQGGGGNIRICGQLGTKCMGNPRTPSAAGPSSRVILRGLSP